MSKNKKPNIIVFMPDQLRADCIGTFGESMVKTPNFDRLASMGVGFKNCFVQHTVCAPSRCSFMTGWYPHVRGHRTLNYLLRKEEPNLMKYLRDDGYWVEWYGKNDLFNQDSFDMSVDHRGKKTTEGYTFIENPWPDDHKMHYSFSYGEKMGKDILDGDYSDVMGAIDFLNNRNSEQPFFLYLPILFPHPPYNVHEPYFSMYDRKSVPLPAKVDYSERPKFMERYHKELGMDKLGEEEYREIIATYYGMISRTDALFGELLDSLEENNLMDNTAIYVFSDHGDYTCDYGLVEKWWTGLTDNLVRVPMIVKPPKGLDQGIVVDDMIELIDFFPTVMEMAGIEDYHCQFGKSLMPFVNNEKKVHREFVFAEGGHHPQDKHCREYLFSPGQAYYPKTKMQYESFELLHKAVMIRSSKWKYIKHMSDIAELYDLENDPREEKNVANRPENENVIRILEGELLKWYMETCDFVPKDLDERDVKGF